MALPPFHRKSKPVSTDCLKIGEIHQRESDKTLCAVYNTYRDKAISIAYKYVPFQLSTTIAEWLTHPTPYQKERWRNVVATMGETDLVKHGKYEYHSGWRDGGEARTPFHLFLSNDYRTKPDSNLWELIYALWENNCTDILETVLNDFIAIVSSHSVDSGETEPPTPPVSMESGVFMQSLSSVGSQSREPISCSILDQSREPITYSIHDQENIPPRQNECLLNPKPEQPLSYCNSTARANLDGNVDPTRLAPRRENDEDFTQYLPIFSAKNKIPDRLFPTDDSDGTAPSKTIKIFISHTLTEEDQRAAEEIAYRLRNEFQFDAYLLKHYLYAGDFDASEFVLQVLEHVDFVVPVLSREYLQQIQPVGDPDDMPNDRLVLRYFHAVSLRRVINKNSLNYLIRPVMLEDVTYGMVRRLPEFSCALKYPTCLGRLAKNLHDTKKYLSKVNFSRN